MTLLTQPNYVLGVRTLGASLAKSGSAYPLTVMVTEAIDDHSRRLLTEDGCLLYDVDPLSPADASRDGYANARFAEVWTKLTAWRLTDFERVVFLDADMLVVQNMDELFTVELPAGGIAACCACRCNPNRIASYPASWTPESCDYTGGADPEEAYFNGGLLVLRPDEAVFAELLAELAAVADLSRYPFAEQDFLNEHYRRRWRALPYSYNALKTLPFQHPSVWNPAEVKNIHYIIDKPWDKTPQPGERYYQLDALWWDVASKLQRVASS